MLYYKIFDKKTGLFAPQNYWCEWDSEGHTWTHKPAVRAAITRLRRRANRPSVRTQFDMNDLEVKTFVLTEVNTGIPVDKF
jgi:hypothetical protein